MKQLLFVEKRMSWPKIAEKSPVKIEHSVRPQLRIIKNELTTLTDSMSKRSTSL